MTFAISTSPSEELPVRDDGTVFPYVFTTPEGASIFSDTLTEIVEQIIPGYADLDESDFDPHFEARLDTLTAMANQAQAVVVAALEAEGQFVVEDLSEDTLTALFTPKGSVILEFDEWQEDIPLILFATDYSPFSDVAQPTGANIRWLSAGDERTFLKSLEVLGAGELSCSDGSDPDGV